jgi:glutamyl-tRNA(Gln) amidotransferase subunit E
MSTEPRLADAGLKVGLEIHQQLSTGKLFCRCPSDLEERVSGTFVRRLRATKSEQGEVDQAALAEGLKQQLYTYEMTPATSCLVDADEEPPHALNDAALEVALTMGFLASMDLVDEVHVMRKIVVDGSNTTGFQRTALVAGGGALPMADGTKLALQSLCLEEDSAREMAEKAGAVTYRLDRLGIPLIEIATAPDIRSGEQAREVAARIGELLRATRRAKRGIGTIRQDLNVSVDGGNRVELKGVQELRTIPQVIAEEARRQRRLVKAAQALKARGVEGPKLPLQPIDLTEVFARTTSKLVRRALDEGGRVWGIRLDGFAGTLGESLSGEAGVRVLGPELSQRARVMGLGGMIHNEEGDLGEKYGIAGAEVAAVREKLAVGRDDCFLFAAGPADVLGRAFKTIADRARLAPQGTPTEVRAVNLDDTERFSTRFLRPMPGAARMYPETDIPPIPLEARRLGQVKARLPQFPELRLAEIVRRTGIAPALGEQLSQTDNLDRFEEVALDETSGSAPDASQTIATNSALARLLLTEVAQDERDGKLEWNNGRVALQKIRDALQAGEIPKEAVAEVYAAVARGGKSMEAALAGSKSLDPDEARRIIRTLVEGMAALVREKGEAAQGPLMGAAMKELRGKVDGKLVAELLREEIGRLRGRS